MTTLRALLAIALLFGVYLIGLIGMLVSVGMVIGGLFLIWNTTDSGSINVAIILIAAGTLGVYALVKGMITVRRPNRVRPDSVLVLDEDAPQLWRFVRDLAAEVGIPAPDELRLTAEANAAVTEEARLLGLRGGRRCLYLGVPLLAELRVDELRALLGHEFGHYLGRHARMGALAHRGYLALGSIMNNLGDVRVARLMWGYAALLHLCFGMYTRLYARVSFAVRRRQEFEADRAAVRIAGRQAMADALRTVTATGVLWQDFVATQLKRTRMAGYLPDQPTAAFTMMLADEDCRRRLAELKLAEPDGTPTARFASHPNLAKRLAALAEHPDTDVPPTDDVSPSTWQYPAAALAPVVFGLLPNSVGDEPTSVPTQRWLDECARALAPPAPTRRLLDVAAAIAGRDPDKATLNTVFEVLATGHVRDLADGLAGRRPDGEDAAELALFALCDKLFAVLAHGLVGASCATWRVSWIGPSELALTELDLDGVDNTPGDELAALVFEAIDHPSAVERLRFRLITLGLNLDRPPEVADVRRPLVLPVGEDPVTRTHAHQVRRFGLAAGGGIAFVAVLVWVIVSFPTRQTRATPTLPLSSGFSDVFTPKPWYDYNPPTLNFTLPPIPPIHLPDLFANGPITVRPGDTLSSIAQCHSSTVAELQRLNGLGGSTLIRAGQQLTVPNPFFPTGPNC